MSGCTRSSTSPFWRRPFSSGGSCFNPSAGGGSRAVAPWSISPSPSCRAARSAPSSRSRAPDGIPRTPPVPPPGTSPCSRTSSSPDSSCPFRRPWSTSASRSRSPRSGSSWTRRRAGAAGCRPVRQLFALLRHLGALLPRLGQPDRDRLLAALHLAAVTRLAALQRSLLAAVHRALHALRCAFAVLARAVLLSRVLFARGHVRLLYRKDCTPCLHARPRKHRATIDRSSERCR